MKHGAKWLFSVFTIPLRPCLVTGQIILMVLTYLNSVLSHQVRTVPPPLELCAPILGNTVVINSKTSLICNLTNTTLVSAVCDGRKIQKLKSGVFQLGVNFARMVI